MSKRLLIMAGGTGGHVFPGLAVAHQLQQEGWQIHWLGTADRMEAQLVPAHGYPISFIDIKGVRGNGVLRLLAAPWRIVKSVLQAWSLIGKVKPDLVLGMGGYAAGPGGVAAWLRGIPLILHEQNAAAGMTNRLLSRLADKVLMGFAGAFGASAKTEVVGNPVRDDVLALGAEEKSNCIGRSLHILIVGGSLGARVLNEVVPEALSLLDNISVRHQTGKGNQDKVAMSYRDLGVAEVGVSEFITDMAAAYRWADLVICRAGALTVAEVAAAGIPAIFVPLPHAVDDHQTRNAESLVSVGAARLLPQSRLNVTSLREMVGELNRQRDKLDLMAAAARQAAIPDATSRVVAVCKQLVQ
ncbi:MAG: undecaprenyldiphospho-muramoylpentapeptide beta-N-acetylglucosaminyltransferase [Aeromonadaceae bacterium]|nr:undecaprenyldiphospho-muramoylpentapeptide beta-N-acetylglucosaminyltransferase [Aeromonadaceae bacterium]